MSSDLKYSNWLVTAVLLFVGARVLFVISRGINTDLEPHGLPDWRTNDIPKPARIGLMTALSPGTLEDEREDEERRGG